MKRIIQSQHIFESKLKTTYSKLSSIPHSDLILLAISVFTIIAIKFYQFPSLTYHAELFAENGTNFFINAYNLDFISNLKTLDAGYIPLIQRITAVLLVKVFHIINYYPFASQLIAISSIAIFSSIINLNIFRKIHDSSAIRFILGISIGLISDYELNVFINFIYYGAFLLFLLFFIDKEKLNKFLMIILSILSSAILLSKGQFIVFIPVYLFFTFFHFKRKEIKSFIYFLSGFMAGLIQFFILLNTQPKTTNGIFLYMFMVLKTTYFLFLTYKHSILGYIDKEGTTFLLVGFILSLIFLGLKKAYEKKEMAIIYMFLLANFIAFCSLFLSVMLVTKKVDNHTQNIINTASSSKSLSTTSIKVLTEIHKERTDDKNIFDIKYYANLRSLFISNLLIFFIGSLIIIYIFPNKSQKIIVLLLICFSSGAFFQIKGNESLDQKYKSFSQWNEYGKLLKEETYCIPVNFYTAWFLIKKDCYFLAYKDLGRISPTDKKIKEISLNEFKGFENWKINAVVIINKPTQFFPYEKITAYAYSKDNKQLGIAKQLVPSDFEFIYFKFNKEIENAETIVFRKESGEKIELAPNYSIFGNETTKKKTTIIF